MSVTVTRGLVPVTQDSPKLGVLYFCCRLSHGIQRYAAAIPFFFMNSAFLPPVLVLNVAL